MVLLYKTSGVPRLSIKRQDEGLTGQIPDPRQPDLTAPIREEEEVGFEIVSEPLHDEGSYGEHHGFPR